MKKVTLPIIAALAACSSIQAATYTVQNSGTPADDPRFADSNGNLFIGSTGAATFGYFVNDAAVTGAVDAATLFDSDWEEFGSNEDVFNATDPVVGDGLFSIQGTSLDTSFNNKNIYLVVGNNSTLSLADEFFIFKFTETFQSVETSGTPTVDFTNSTSGTVLVGNPGPLVDTGFFTDVPTFRTESIAAVPEPSSTALLGLGTVGFLLRRRR